MAMVAGTPSPAIPPALVVTGVPAPVVWPPLAAPAGFCGLAGSFWGAVVCASASVVATNVETTSAVFRAFMVPPQEPTRKIDLLFRTGKPGFGPTAAPKRLSGTG